MNKKILIIFAVFALIISCKNYATGKDIKQNAKGKIKGFLDKVLDPAKDKITSNGPKVDEVAKKLQEEELMQGDGPNNGMIALLPVLPENNKDNIQVSVVKAEGQNGGKQEEGEMKEAEAKVEEKKVAVAEKKEKQEVTEDNSKEIEVSEEQKSQEETRVKKEKEIKSKEESEHQKRQQEKEEQQRRAREQEEAEKKAEAEREREKQRKQEEQKKQAKEKIKDLVDKIAKINGDIDSVKGQTSLGAQELIDKVTGPIYDDFVDGNNSIRTTWGELEEESEDEGLGKLLEELSGARDKLRNKLNEGNKPHAGLDKEPKLKTSVDVSDIKGDLEKVKSGLEEVKKYFENEDNFEEIKGYIEDSNSY